MSEYDEKFLKDFEAFKLANPTFFPEDTPLEKQHRYYEGVRQSDIQKHNEKEMDKVNKEITEDNKEKLRLCSLKAIKALSNNPMEKFIAAYKLSHVGHYQILRGIVYAECLKSSATTKGLQPTITGSRGSGKSHAVRTTVRLIPKDAVYIGTLSPKALFYRKSPPKTTFYMDDAVLEPDIVSFLKRKQTEFQQKTTYGTVINKEWKEQEVDKRMVFITTSVAQQGDEQLSDRALLIDIKNEKTDDREFYEFENIRRTKGLPEFPECEEVQLCRDMLSHIRNNEFRVVMPSIDFLYYSDRRLVGMTYDLMEASAILNYLSREYIMDNDVIVVTATVEDLANALDFDMFKNSDREAIARLSKSERAFDEKCQNLLNGSDSLSFTEKQLAEQTEMSVPGMRNYLYGRENTPNTIKDGVGLCGKTTWYVVDTKKDIDTDSIKNYIIIKKHTYENASYAWINKQQ
jgi:hypothetical protein